MSVTGDYVFAQQALEWGLVNEVVAPEQATEVGTAVGAPSVSTGAHGGDSGPTPAAFNPATANSYAVECVRPFTVALRYVAPAMSSFAARPSRNAVASR